MLEEFGLRRIDHPSGGKWTELPTVSLHSWRRRSCQRNPQSQSRQTSQCVEIGRNTSHFPGKPISFALSQQGSEKHKQVSELVEHVTEHFQSQSLLHLAAKRGNTKHLRRLLDAGEHVDAVSPDKSGDKETPLMLAARFNQTEILDFLVQKGASLEMRDDMITV